MERYDEQIVREVKALELDYQQQIAALREQVATLTAERDVWVERHNTLDTVKDEQLNKCLTAIDAERTEKSKWIQAVGLASTCAGGMLIDVEHPIEMMQTVCAKFADLQQQLDAELGVTE